MSYIFVGVCCLFIGLLIPLLPEIKSNVKRRQLKKRYDKLLNGIPKRVVRINDFHHAWEYRDYPFYINGQSVGIGSPGWWHCNDESKQLYDIKRKPFGYLTRQIQGSKQLGKNKWRHTWILALTNNPNLLGKKAEVSAIVAVH